MEQEFNSLHAPREAALAYIASQRSEGWIALPDHYDDGGISGGTLERPALQRLLRDIEAGMVDVVVVYKIDRLSRSLTDFARLVDVFERHNVTFVSVTQQFNTTTSMGRLTLNILLSFAQFEREVIRSKEADDVGASVFFLFGRPGLLRPEPPTLAYAWTSAATPQGSVVRSPRHPDTLRTIVLEGGTANLGKWIAERRNLVQDYRLAFGTDPPHYVEVIALWSDSDQTGQEVEAFYGHALALPK